MSGVVASRRVRSAAKVFIVVRRPRWRRWRPPARRRRSNSKTSGPVAVQVQPEPGQISRRPIAAVAAAAVPVERRVNSRTTWQTVQIDTRELQFPLSPSPVTNRDEKHTFQMFATEKKS